jgi:hypothetical protein
LRRFDAYDTATPRAESGGGGDVEPLLGDEARGLGVRLAGAARAIRLAREELAVCPGARVLELDAQRTRLCWRAQRGLAPRSWCPARSRLGPGCAAARRGTRTRRSAAEKCADYQASEEAEPACLRWSPLGWLPRELRGLPRLYLRKSLPRAAVSPLSVPGMGIGGNSHIMILDTNNLGVLVWTAKSRNPTESRRHRRCSAIIPLVLT